MTERESKMTLSADALDAVNMRQAVAVDELLNPDVPKANVVGVGSGVKWTNGQPTGEPAVVVLVTHKEAPDRLSEDDLIPSELAGMPTDVLQVGYLTAGVDLLMPGTSRLQTDSITISPPVTNGHAGAVEAPITGIGIELLTKRVRPAKGGYSVGNVAITAGTISTCVYDILPGGTISPPAPGVGIPSKYYILSNNHVLANSNLAPIGSAVVQPGPFDGGVAPADTIATLSRFVPITFFPPTPLALHKNIVDCAVAEGDFQNLDREVYWTGPVRGWRTRANVLKMVGQTVKKTGRTTNFTLGRITAVNATVVVNYGGGRQARFLDQIVTTAMSAGGDSGSLLMTVDSVAVGLLFAGSNIATIFNQIENVRSRLRVEVAEQIL